MDPFHLSVVIICKNEEKHIARCLQSVHFAKEVILVDSGSTDNTLNIATKYPNVKIFSTEWKGFAETKTYGVSKAKNDWILWLDADEVVTQELAQEWFSAPKNIDLNKTAAIAVPRKTFFLGHWVKHCGWYPDYVTRFFHKQRARFNANIIHESLIIAPSYKKVKFSSCLLHYSFSSLKQYFDKINQYGLLSAQEMQRKGKKIYTIQIFLNPLWAFVKSYFLKKGFLDGHVGIIVCVGAALSSFVKYSNYFFLKKYGYVEKFPE